MKIEIPDTLFNQEELDNTPNRYKKFLKEWENDQEFKFTVFDNNGYDQMVILKDIEFSSICSHHLLPFKGKAHIGYIPGEKICGISKLARVLDKYAHRPQLQERLTQQIADYIMDKLDAKGVMVVIDATHDCMRIRGIKKQNSSMVTSAIKGVFKESTARAEFMGLIK